MRLQGWLLPRRQRHQACRHLSLLLLAGVAVSHALVQTPGTPRSQGAQTAPHTTQRTFPWAETRWRRCVGWRYHNGGWLKDDDLSPFAGLLSCIITSLIGLVGSWSVRRTLQEAAWELARCDATVWSVWMQRWRCENGSSLDILCKCVEGRDRRLIEFCIGACILLLHAFDASSQLSLVHQWYCLPLSTHPAAVVVHVHSAGL